jgi:uncharacterized protein (TIGR02996 family)
VTLTTTIAAMLAAIKAAPDDGTLRLALADALEETDPSEGGDAAWAELIRAQVEMGRHVAEVREGVRYYNNWPLSAEVKAVERRELDLLAEHEDRWRRGPACGRCGGKGNLYLSHKSRKPTFPTCQACHGTGWAGPLGATSLQCEWSGSERVKSPIPWAVPIEWRRGFIAKISTPLADVFAGDTVTEWAARVARWPCVALEEWGLTDVEFVEREMSSGTRYYPFASSRIPWSVRDEVILTPDGFYGRTTPDAARLALAKAVAAVVNEAAHD